MDRILENDLYEEVFKQWFKDFNISIEYTIHEKYIIFYIYSSKYPTESTEWYDRETESFFTEDLDSNYNMIKRRKNIEKL